MSTGEKDDAFYFVFLLHSSLLLLLAVFLISHWNGEECVLLNSVKPSMYFLPFRSLLIYVNIFITLWDPYHPLPYFSVFMFKQKSNQCSHISAPNSKFFSIYFQLLLLDSIQKKQTLSISNVSKL